MPIIVRYNYKWQYARSNMVTLDQHFIDYYNDVYSYIYGVLPEVYNWKLYTLQPVWTLKACKLLCFYYTPSFFLNSNVW